MPLIRCFIVILPLILSGCVYERIIRHEAAPQVISDRPVASAGWDDSDWQRVLATIVSADGTIRFDALVQNAEGSREALERYARQIARYSPANQPDWFPNETDRLAYHLNSHNAIALVNILRKDLPRNVVLAGIFKMPITISQQESTLEELLNNVIRSTGDPRVHFAVCTFSRSSPSLRAEPYSGARLDEQLSDQARRYLSDPRAVKPVGERSVALTELLTRFYPEDFKSDYARRTGRGNPSLLEVLAPLADPDSPLQRATKYETMPFDWTLNAAQ